MLAVRGMRIEFSEVKVRHVLGTFRCMQPSQTVSEVRVFQQAVNIRSLPVAAAMN